ncbi:hypothetical protein MW887_000674 [Aspergillus wentii]|nr:hypothetical protein MW887_000674 [Aspergillus wentii]
MSRRLGRPAKKRELSSDEYRPKECPDRRRDKKVKLSKRRSRQDKEDEKVDKPMMDDTSVEESLQTPMTEMENVPYSVSDNFDLSDNWLQGLVSHQIPDSAQERSLLDSLDYPSKTEDSLTFSVGFKDPIVMAYPATSETLDPIYYNLEPQPLPDLPMDYMDSLSISSPECHKKSAAPPETTMNNFQPPLHMMEHRYDLPSPIEFNSFDTDSYCSCQCHEQATRELLRVNLCAARTTPPSPIDTVLTCQRGLQQLAETILHCTTCSRTRMNLLMVVIVCIDGLLTTLEATTTAKSAFLDGVADDKECIAANPEMSPAILGKKYKDGSVTFKEQIEACPLLVGNFRVPTEEKYTFIKQVLQTRLSGLLATIRRIRGCTQGILASSASKGRLIMMMETDRRLQMIMMKIKMLCR